MKNSAGKLSKFEDDEYVVYNSSQIAMRYLIEYSTQAKTRPSAPNIPTGIVMMSSLPPKNAIPQPATTSEETKTQQLGLRSTSGAEIPLKAVTVKAILLDLACEVSVFQKFRNESGITRQY